VDHLHTRAGGADHVRAACWRVPARRLAAAKMAECLRRDRREGGGEMTVSIPLQFQAAGFRFVELGEFGDWRKRPVEYFWECLTLEEAKKKYNEELAAFHATRQFRPPKKLLAGEPSRLTNYAFNDPALLQHLARGLNFGIINGSGPNGAGLATLDADNLPRLAELVDLSKLPPTLEAGRREENGEPIPERRHFHYLSNLEGKHHLKDPDTGEDLGDLRGTGGFQVVGPGSLHPSGAVVEILEDRPLAEISGAELLRILKPVLEASSPSKLAANRAKLEGLKPKRRPPTATDADPFEGVSILDVIDVSGFKESGGQLFGSNPVHGSDTGHNLVVNPAKNSWWCGRHKTGGGVALWLAVEAGIIHCDESKSGAISGSKFIEVLDYAKSKGIIPDDGRRTDETEARDLLEILETKLAEDPDGWAQDPDVKRLLASYRRRDAVGAEALLKRAGVRGDLKKALMTDLKRIDSDEKARQRRATAAKSRTTEEDEDGFCIEDFCYLTDDEKYAFSPTTATKSIIAKSKLAMTATETDIYRFDGQIYRNDGDRKIDLNLCRVAKDHVLGKNVQEVIRRVKNELLEDPVVFDCNPYLLGVRNGVVDLQTGEFRDYRPEDRITYQIDVTYDPAARCPRYVQFLEEIQPNVTDRLTLVDWYPATAIRKPLPYVLFLLGLGRNGKGIYERLMKRFFGASAFRDMALSEVTKNNFAAGNFYKKLGWIATEQSGKKKATIGTDFIKLVTGFGSIDADRKNLSRIQFEAYFQTIVDTNAMPKIEDTSIGWMERFCKQDLPYVFVSNPDPKNPLEKKKDPHLFSKLTTDEELSGILNLLIWRAKETCETEAITKRPASELFNEYSQQSASVSTFCDQFLEYEEGLTEPNTPTSDIYDAYKKWCSYLVGEVVDEGYFGRYLKRFCNNRNPSRPRRGGKRFTAYPGLLFHKDKVNVAIEALSNGWTSKDKHGQVVDEKDFSKTDNKSTSGTSGQVELWNQVVKGFGPCRPEAREDKDEDFLSKEEIHQNPRPTCPPVQPIAGDLKNEKSTCPLPVSTSPLPVQGEPEGGEAVAGDSGPEAYQTVAENLEDAARREADYLEHVKTPEEDRLPTAEESEVLEDLAGRILENWPGLPEMLLWEKARGKLGSRLPLAVVRHWLSESGYTATGEKYGGGVIWNLPTSEEAVA